jgi:hypothetical protein
VENSILAAKKRPKSEPSSTQLDISPLFLLPIRLFKDWPRVRKSRNGAGEMFWEVDLRPHGKRKYFSSKDAALREAQIQRTRLCNLCNEALEGFEFTLEQRTDAKMAMAVLAASGLSLTQAAKIGIPLTEYFPFRALTPRRIPHSL